MTDQTPDPDTVDQYIFPAGDDDAQLAHIVGVLDAGDAWPASMIERYAWYLTLWQDAYGAGDFHGHQPGPPPADTNAEP